MLGYLPKKELAADSRYSIVVLKVGMKHTVKMGLSLIRHLRENGFLNAELIGSVGKGRSSDHDIDVLLKDYENTSLILSKLCVIFSDNSRYVSTDWGGFFFYDTKWGNIDLFFSTDQFDY